MRKAMTGVPVLVAILATAAAGQPLPVAGGDNILTRYLDWADIHPPARAGRLTIFPLTLSRSPERLAGVLTMDQALSRGLLAVEELDKATVERARFVNRSPDRMIFLMAGELIAGGRQNRTLQSDALLAPNSSAELPLYCVQKGRWQGGKRFESAPGVAPQGVRERAAGKAGQDAVWSEVARANARLKSVTGSGDLAAAMTKPENARRLAGLREKIGPHLPRLCVGLVAAVDGRIVAADLLNSPELFAAMRQKVLDSYLSEYGWPVPVRRSSLRPAQAVSAEQVRDYLRGCYNGRFVAGEMRGAGRIHYLRGPRSGQTLGYQGRHMVHTALMKASVVPVRPRPLPVPEPRR
jgi:hypothetical protein